MPNNTKIKIGQEFLEFSKDADKDSIIVYKGKPYKFLVDLAENCPQLLENPQNLSVYAVALNYFLFEKEFEVIVDVEEYINKYWARKEQEMINPSENPEIAQMWQLDYDVYVLLSPMAEDELFFCCLENLENGLPFLLTTPFPINAYEFEFHLQPIPFAAEE